MDALELLAFGFSAAAYIPYVYGIHSGTIRPTISSWIAWGLMDVVLFVSIYYAGETAWQIAAYIVGVVCVLVACAYKGANLGWTRLDSLCVVFVVAAMLAWIASGDPVMAIIYTLAGAVVSMVPIMRNLYADPAREKLLPWFLVFAGGVFATLAVKTFTIAAAATPITFCILQAITIALISRKFSRRNINARGY